MDFVYLPKSYREKSLPICDLTSVSKMYLKISYWGNLPAQVLYLSKKAYFAGIPSSVSYLCVTLAEKKILLAETKSLKNFNFYFF